MLKLKLKPEESKPPASEPEKPANPVRLRLRPNKGLVEGYDSEAPDREEDPVIEEAVVLRMLPGVPALAALHKAAETNDFSGVSIRFEDRRHAIVGIEGESFVAQLMDLPTITEVHKTFDRKNIFKTVDVSQILLVTHKVGDAPPDFSRLMRFTSDPQAYPHGLTPPLYNVRNRRFQKRMSNKAIENLEAQVEELLQKDAAAKEVKIELLPASAVAAQQALAEAAKAAAAARAAESDMEVDEELDEELEKAMMDDEDTGAEGSASEDDDDDDDDDEDEEEDEERPNGEQYDDDESRQHSKQLREEIKELEATIEAKERAAGSLINDIMRARHMDAVNRLRAELEKKQDLLNDAELEDEGDNDDYDDADSGADGEGDDAAHKNGDVDGDDADEPDDAEAEAEAEAAARDERVGSAEQEEDAGEAESQDQDQDQDQDLDQEDSVQKEASEDDIDDLF